MRLLPATHLLLSPSVTAAFGLGAARVNSRSFASIAERTAMGTKGEFKRKVSAWRNWISRDEGSEFQPEKGRYHLYVSYACPWAHRAFMTRALKGLEDAISVTLLMPTWQPTKPDDPNDSHSGWHFADEKGEPFPNSIGLGGPFPPSYPECGPDPIYGAKTMREVYERCGDTAQLFSVPVLYDKKLKTIVSNESSEIIQMLNSEFNEFATSPDLDLAPPDMKSAMAEVDEWVYPTINNGVYRCGAAKSQEAYDEAIDVLTTSFDRLEGILSTQRYVAGDRFTLSDVRLFMTLLRFDEVYVVYFKTNTRSVAKSPALLNYCREIYQMPGVAGTVSMFQIKMHYFTSHPDKGMNRWSIIPRGADFEDLLREPHNRGSI